MAHKSAYYDRRTKSPRKVAAGVTTPLHVRKAYHEAAHAVFALKNGMLHEKGLVLHRPDDGVPDGAGGGVAVLYSSDEERHKGKVLQQDVETLLAATVAEIILLDRSSPRPGAMDMLNLHIGAVDDIRQALAYLEDADDDPSNVYVRFREAMGNAGAAVVQHWDEIEAVAKAALETGVLSGSEISDLVEKQATRSTRSQRG